MQVNRACHQINDMVYMPVSIRCEFRRGITLFLLCRCFLLFSGYCASGFEIQFASVLHIRHFIILVNIFYIGVFFSLTLVQFRHDCSGQKFKLSFIKVIQIKHLQSIKCYRIRYYTNLICFSQEKTKHFCFIFIENQNHICYSA